MLLINYEESPLLSTKLLTGRWVRPDVACPVVDGSLIHGLRLDNGIPLPVGELGELLGLTQPWGLLIPAVREEVSSE